MFSILILLIWVGGIVYYSKCSKPTGMFFNSAAARSDMLDKYLVIDAMPSGTDKQLAYKNWQQECFIIHSQIKQQEQN